MERTRDYMSIQIVLFVALVSTADVPELQMRAHDPIGLAFEHDRRVQVAQGKTDKSVPGALPGRSESSQEDRPSTRAPRKSKKPAAEKETKDKETPPKGGKKDPQ